MIKKGLLLFYIALIYQYSLAQAPRFESFNVVKNVSNVQVNAIEQDNQGFIWIGSNHGLIKYDGVEFKTYTEADNLYNNTITSLAYDSLNACLWIGHKDGKISQLINKEFVKFDPEEGLGSQEVSSIFIDNKGVMWFTTLSEGVYYYKGQNRKRLYNLNSDDGLLDNYVYSLVQYQDSIYFLSTDKGISVYNINTKMFIDEINTQDGIPDNLVKALAIQENYLWIGMHDGGVCRYNILDKSFSHMAEWEFGALNTMVLTHDNEVYVSTDKKGVVKIEYDDQQNAWYSNYKKNNGLVDIRTKTLFYDREHNLWVGTKKGLSLRKNNNIEFFDSNSDFNLSQIFSLSIDDDNRFWIASQNGLHMHYRDKMGSYTTKKMLDKPEYEIALFISVYKDFYGNIWAGTYGFGAFCINPKTLEYKLYNTNAGLASNDVFHITGDSLNVWMSTAGGGVSKLSLKDFKSIKNFTMEQGLTSNYVFSVYLENSDKAWLSTDGGGVVIIENEKVRKFENQKLDSLTSKVYSISPDTHGNLWFNIGENGVFTCENQNQSNHFHEFNGLSSSNLQSIMSNCSNQIVAISNQGIDIINIANSNVASFGEESGVSSLEPNLNAIFKDKQDNIYAGTANGIVKINSHKHDTLIKPKLFITQKRLFQNTIEKQKHTFNHKQNNFSFSFTALWYQSPTPLNYRYKLEGYDIEWSPESSIRTVTYPKLPDGKYKFIVQAKLSDGTWIESADGTYNFQIKPPFWKTPLFIIFAIVFGILLVYAFINYRIRKLKVDKENLEIEVQKRTAEIRMQKEEIESQRDEIEAQRNHVMEQHDKIEDQNKDIKASITYASRIQRAVLPPLDHFNELLNAYFLFFKPRDIVSGDFYYLNQAHGKVIVAAADCTGHGVPGAFMSLLSVSILNQIFSTITKEFNAADILNKLRFELKKSLRQTGEDDTTKDGLDISLSVIDFQNKVLDFSGAFNPLLLIRDKAMIEYKGDKMPIGVFMKDNVDFKNQRIELNLNDMLYMYSDGMQDQFGGEKNRKFLPKNLRNLLLENSAKPMLEQEQILESTLNAWKGHNNQVDDILIIGLRI